MVNKENVLALRDLIASKRWKFDMSEPYFKPECGSAGCIGGHAAALWPDVSIKGVTWSTKALCLKLGITGEQHHDLCFPYIDLDTITRAHAVDTLARLAETGEVEWRIT